MRRSVRSVIRAGLVSALVAGGVLASAPAAPAADTVTITFTLHGCDRCVVTAYHATDPDKKVWTKQAMVRRNEAVLTVPAGKTKGMSFTLQTPGQASAFGGNAVPVVALGFKGFEPGTRVTAAQTRARGQKASWCWAGTAKDVTVPVLLQWQQARSEVYAWASPSLTTYNDADNWQPTQAMGTQDAPWCESPKAA